MRTKSETRRKTILETAYQLFLARGFSAASMAEISERVGGSKATLYSYFASKEELFVEVIKQFADEQFTEVLGLLDPEAALDSVLEQFGVRFIGLISHPELVCMHRTVYAESGHTRVGQLFYERGPQEIIKEIGYFLERCMAQGKLRQEAPVIAAQHLIGLLRAEIIDRMLYRVIETAEPAEIAASSKRAVNVFLRAYRPE
jgi:AcrR family transcriptional regulator